MSHAPAHVSRIKGPAAKLLWALLLALAVACSPDVSDRTQPKPRDGGAIESRILAIQAEVKRIDAAYEAPEAAGRRQLSKDLPDLQFYGLFEGSDPIFLSAVFSQSQVVRTETHYLLHGRPILIRVEKDWDVDDSSRAPEPPTQQDFYIDNDTTVRRVIQVTSSPPIARTDDTARPAASLVDRSRLITQVLLGNSQGTNAARSLEAFPEAEQTEARTKDTR